MRNLLIRLGEWLGRSLSRRSIARPLLIRLLATEEGQRWKDDVAREMARMVIACGIAGIPLEEAESLFWEIREDFPNQTIPWALREATDLVTKGSTPYN